MGPARGGAKSPQIKAIYDYLVVGDRPAGGVCPHELAEKGLKVLILEREPIPRLKVCAGELPDEERPSRRSGRP